MYDVFALTEWPLYASNSVYTPVVLGILLAAAYGQSLSVVAVSQVR